MRAPRRELVNDLTGVRKDQGWCVAMCEGRDLATQDGGFQDYVIVHELLHLRVGNHGRVFKALMSAHVPDWRRHDARRLRGDRQSPA